LPEEATEPGYVHTTRLEAFSDGVFAIAITLLVLDLAIGESGSVIHRVLDAWPFYLAYIISFLTIGAAWLAHNVFTDRLAKADAILLRLNLLLLLFVSFLPFPTRLVAEGLDNGSDERVYVTMYGLTLLVIRVFLFVLDEYARREHLYAQREREEQQVARKGLLPVVGAYSIAILMGLAFPAVSVGLYCLLAIYLVIPFGALRRVLFSR
jgi:uncharacterized membrane protein